MSFWNPTKARRYWPSLTAILIGLAGTAALFTAQWRSAGQADQVRFDTLTHFMQERLDDRVEKYEQMVVLVREFFIRNDLPSRTQWLQLVGRLRLPLNYPGLHGLGYAPRLTGRQLRSPSPDLLSVLGDGALSRSNPVADEVIWPVLYWYPKPPLQDPPMGFDLSRSALPWRQAELSANHNAMHVTGRLPGGEPEPPFDTPGFCMVHTVLDATAPLSLPSAPGETLSDVWNRDAAARVAHWQGTLVAKIDLDQLLKDLLEGSALEVAFEIFDGSDPSRSRRMNDQAAVPGPGDRTRRPESDPPRLRLADV